MPGAGLFTCPRTGGAEAEHERASQRTISLPMKECTCRISFAENQEFAVEGYICEYMSYRQWRTGRSTPHILTRTEPTHCGTRPDRLIRSDLDRNGGKHLASPGEMLDVEAAYVSLKFQVQIHALM